jgi:hypothetical protein
MPQTVTCKYHCHLSLAANDLATVNITGRSVKRNVLVKNSGPGVVWGSIDPGQAAAVANANNFTLKTGEQLKIDNVSESVMTLNADTASTLCDVVVTG